MYAKLLTPMTQCPHVVHHNFECSNGLRALHQMLVFPQDSKKAERRGKNKQLQIYFSSMNLLPNSHSINRCNPLKSVKTDPFTVRGPRILYSEKYVSLNATLSVINLRQSVVHIFQCTTPCKLNYTGYILMRSLMKISGCLYCVSFNIKNKGEPRTLIPRKCKLSAGILLLIQA